MGLFMTRDPNNPASFARHASSPDVNTFGHAHSCATSMASRASAWRMTHRRPLFSRSLNGMLRMERECTSALGG
jgi:hypothetical protein